jgi:hypothetical protein
MNRGESDCYITDSNKLNVMEIMKMKNDPGINSDTIIHFVNNLPIWKYCKGYFSYTESHNLIEELLSYIFCIFKL